MNSIAIIATLCLALCPIQQTIRCIKDGHSEGLAGGGLILWISGCTLMLLYLLMTPGSDIYVILNFTMAIILSGIQNFYKFFPRKK